MALTTQFVTDGGLETDLIYHHGFDLPEFAAFPLLADERGRTALASYYAGYADIAATHQVGLQLETPTWRANPDWGAALGLDATALAAVNRDAVHFLRGLREEWSDRIPEIRISGQVGPRGDGYRPGDGMHPDQAAAYHAPQIEAFAEAGADLVAALTLIDVGEAVGVVRAARAAGIAVLVGFTVEVDGRLPSGLTLTEAIAGTDEAAAPDSFLVNCAHPTHVVRALAGEGPWQRVTGLRVNASELSHAELDALTEIDDGDPHALAVAHRQLESLLPEVSLVGGCCGTDVRHVSAIWADRTALREA